MRMKRAWAAAAAVAALLAVTAPAEARTLTIGLSTNITTLDPHGSGTVGTDLSVASHLYSTLLVRDPDLTTRPLVATGWELVDDLTWRITLRDGIVFPDGEKLDADAVKWNIERVLNPETRSTQRGWFEKITEIRVIDPLTLELVTSQPHPTLIDGFTLLFLLPPAWTADHQPSLEALGTGPYDLVDYVPGDRVTLRAKENYWGGELAFDEVVFRIIPEDSSRIAALLAGEVDLIANVPPSDIARINESGRARADAIPSSRLVFIKYNSEIPPFQGNSALRQALNYAIDRQAIIDAIWNGYGSVSGCQPLNELYTGYNPDLGPIPYDPDRARALLAEAGYPDGLDLEMDVPAGRYLNGEEISQAVAAQLAEVGVDVHITEYEFGRWLDKFHRAHDMGQLSYIGQSSPISDGGNRLAAFHPDGATSYYENEEYGAVLDQALATFDEAERIRLYQRAAEIFCADPAHIVLFNQPLSYGEALDIQWQARGDDWWRAYDVLPVERQAAGQ